VTTGALLRARRVLSDAGVAWDGPLQRVESAANEVWFAGPYVVRLSSGLGTRRLAHEVDVARSLPEGVPYPPIVHYGRADMTEWLVLERVEGRVLSRAWPDMERDERRSAALQVAEILRQVHHVPAAVDPPFVYAQTLECPHQLPVARAVELLWQARSLPYVDPDVCDTAAELALDLMPALHEPRPVTLVHGDLHFENLLWDGERITAVLDFEWARPGPPDLDLDVVLRFCAEPALHVAADYEDLARAKDYAEVPGWLREGYPEIFDTPRLHDRLILFAIAYDARALLLSPPHRPTKDLSPFHPYNRIRALASGRSHLDLIRF
jgi:aminoglycoside phosphotransferase (APT) family kinase protein